MKNKIFILLFLLFTQLVLAQQNSKDSLLDIINRQSGDTNEVKAILKLAEISGIYDIDTSIKKLLQKSLFLSRELNYPKGEAFCNLLLGANMGVAGNYSDAITLMFKALHNYEQLKDEEGIINSHLGLEGIYREIGDFRNSLEHSFAAKQIVESRDNRMNVIIPDRSMTPIVLAEIAVTYLEMKKLDSAYLYTRKAIEKKLIINNAEWNYPFYLLGKIFTEDQKYKVASETFFTAISLAIQNNYPKDTADIYNSISELYKRMGMLDSSVYYAKQITKNWNKLWPVKILLDANTMLTQVYKLKGNTDSTLKYREISDLLKDSMFSQQKQKEIQNATFNEQVRQQEILTEQKTFQRKIQQYILISGLIVLLLIALLLWRNNYQRNKAYALLERQKHETDKQKIKVERTLEELKSTQSQLIQSEKMASLGELTAGIAHEIQNPLNFVNNFSEVNGELLKEMKDEMIKGNTNDALVLADDAIENQKKINLHGKRADTIVKGMLQHSRSSNSIKEPTDINKLADEYLRLSYHGLRAKDNAFNATIQTDFDSSIEKINIIPQDIGRTILNLLTNAFYAVNEKNKLNIEKYEPTVSVQTKKMNNKVEIKVSDNGSGIPQKIVDKIFQPFFTTKPTGQGTGLGLSLSYDIVRAHGGEIKVNTKENDGTEFTIVLHA